MGMLLLVHLSSSEIMSCKECGQRFATVDALKKHNKLGKEEREPPGTRDFVTQKIGQAEKTGESTKPEPPPG
jgi:ribosome-binding protein aMBF1 (putative translation factor)